VETRLPPDYKDAVFASSRAHLYFFAANAAGLACFLLAGSRFWVDRRVSDVRGDELRAYFGWAFFSFLVFALVVCASVAGLVVSVRKVNWAARLKSALQVVALLLCWLAALWFDAVHRILD
jgi:hypothetical protein